MVFVHNNIFFFLQSTIKIENLSGNKMPMVEDFIYPNDNMVSIKVMQLKKSLFCVKII